MTKKNLIFVLTIALFSAYCTSKSAENESDSSASPVSLDTEVEAEAFEVAEVHFEQNATDVDFEVVFDIIGGDEGLLKLQIVGPDGRPVVDFTAPDASTTGVRSFVFESPEPHDLPSMAAAYPEGVYQFSATNSAGVELRSEATLEHALPATAELLNPEEDAEGVAINGLEISWSEVEGVSAYIVKVEIEDDVLKDNIAMSLSSSTTTFSVPDDFLRPGKEYKIAIGAVVEGGNASFIEASFFTEGEADEEGE